MYMFLGHFEGRRGRGRKATQLITTSNQKKHTSLPLTIHWPDLTLMVLPNYSEGSEMWFLPLTNREPDISSAKFVYLGTRICNLWHAI